MEKRKNLSFDEMEKISGGLSLGDLFEDMVQKNNVFAASGSVNQSTDGSQTEELFCDNCKTMRIFRTGFSGSRAVCSKCGKPKDL